MQNIEWTEGVISAKVSMRDIIKDVIILEI